MPNVYQGDLNSAIELDTGRVNSIGGASTDPRCL